MIDKQEEILKQIINDKIKLNDVEKEDLVDEIFSNEQVIEEEHYFEITSPKVSPSRLYSSCKFNNINYFISMPVILPSSMFLSFSSSSI